MNDKPAKRITGSIYPIEGNSGFVRAAWCQFVQSRDELRSPPQSNRQIPNPFKRGEMIPLPPPADDIAKVVLDGREVGSAYWSMSDEPLICVIVEALAKPLVQEWAAALGGVFREEDWGDFQG